MGEYRYRSLVNLSIQSTCWGSYTSPLAKLCVLLKGAKQDSIRVVIGVVVAVRCKGLLHKGPSRVKKGEEGKKDE